MINRILIFKFSLLTLVSCTESISENQSTEQKEVESQIIQDRRKRPIALENGKFFNLDSKQYLFGGEDSTTHFDVSNMSLKEEQFHYGIGRETFPALLSPEFMNIEEADSLWADSSRFLLALSEQEVKAYAVQDLIRHEIVNDSIGGEPIMAAYCILADLGAIYNRKYGDQLLTFALSGYTYYDDEVWDGMDGFILWDRETESLWWPLIGKAVSGKLKDVKLLERDHSSWKDTNWKFIKENYPDVKVLISGQDFERPETWPQLEDVSSVLTFKN